MPLSLAPKKSGDFLGTSQFQRDVFKKHTLSLQGIFGAFLAQAGQSSKTTQRCSQKDRVCFLKTSTFFENEGPTCQPPMQRIPKPPRRGKQLVCPHALTRGFWDPWLWRLDNWSFVFSKKVALQGSNPRFLGFSRADLPTRLSGCP